MPGPARPSAGGPLPRPSTRCYGRLTQVLRRPLEPGRYAAEPYRKVLRRHGIKQSMSRRGDCLDNAPMESFFASLKKEQIHHARFRTREEARAAVFDYIEVFYNRSSQRTPRYVADGKRFCWPALDTAGRFAWFLARIASSCAAGPSRSARLKS